jgi:multidrug resistance efflux pump
MSNTILPIDPMLIKESYLFHITIRTRVLYMLVVIAIITMIVLLPIIKLSLSIQGLGIIRPVSEKAEIKAIQPEIVTSVHVREGQYVEEGDTLISLRQDIIESKVQSIQNELSKTKQFIKDLNILTGTKDLNIESHLYSQQFTTYKRKVSELDSKIVKARKEEQRNKSLFENKMISAKEYDDLTFNLKLLEDEKKTLESIQMVQWKSDLVRYSSEEENFQRQLNELQKEKQFYTIVSPVTGTIEEFSGIYVGSIMQTGQTIAIISPESDIIAEVYISVKDIGYLYEGQTVKIQIDAFNYIQWGVIEGEVTDVSNDFILADDVPVFLIKCRLNKDFLELKNGVKGYVKKGMTVNARFMVARRSLFQLLYQKSDNWLNPSRNLVSAK